MATKESKRRKLIWLGVFLVAVFCIARAQAQTPAKKKEIQITWLGHAAFELVSSGGTDLLIDPFLTKNPATPAELKNLSRYHPNFILVTHSHGDHLGDAVELAKMSKAKIVSVYMPEAFKKGDLPRELIEPVNVGDHPWVMLRSMLFQRCIVASQAAGRLALWGNSPTADRFTIKAIPGSLATWL